MAFWRVSFSSRPVSGTVPAQSGLCRPSPCSPGRECGGDGGSCRGHPALSEGAAVWVQFSRGKACAQSLFYKSEFPSLLLPFLAV